MSDCSKSNALDITILCKVVDNYGDIGFVYRLARTISKKEPSASLRIVVSDLLSFSKMAPGIDLLKAEQKYDGWTILDWNNSEVCTASFMARPLQIILQCFQCERPAWLDALLFGECASVQPRIVHIVNVEYLTAESWADDFHLLKSGTRSAFVKKVNFMPGFTDKTGGLVLDEPFLTYRAQSRDGHAKLRGASLKAVAPYFSEEECALFADQDVFTVLIFSYPRDFMPIVSALMRFQTAVQKTNHSFRIHVFAANGISLEPFKKAWSEQGRPFEITELPFIPQTVWDALLCMTDFSFVRGEDSLSRACLAGVPFVWHAYVQKDEFQLVKVEALLERMKPFFCRTDYETIRSFWLYYNRKESIALGTEAAAVVSGLFAAGGSENLAERQSELLFTFLMHLGTMKSGFRNFSDALVENGDLTESLLEYLKQLHF